MKNNLNREKWSLTRMLSALILSAEIIFSSVAFVTAAQAVEEKTDAALAVRGVKTDTLKSPVLAVDGVNLLPLREMLTALNI
ncbi:MAG: hypothetical protein LBB94_00735, partial [Clostridiales bacterium]|nr:hypothetical protein [Clostridiales bacterium]